MIEMLNILGSLKNEFSINADAYSNTKPKPVYSAISSSDM